LAATGAGIKRQGKVKSGSGGGAITFVSGNFRASPTTL
jgi:hypothetical protein